MYTQNNNPVGILIQYNLKYNSLPVYTENQFSYRGKLEPLQDSTISLSSVIPEPEIIYASTSGIYTYNFLPGIDYKISVAFFPPGLLELKKQEGELIDLNKTCFEGSSGASYGTDVVEEIERAFPQDNPLFSSIKSYLKDRKNVYLTSTRYNFRDFLDSLLREKVKPCNGDDVSIASKLYYESSLDYRMRPIKQDN